MIMVFQNAKHKTQERIGKEEGCWKGASSDELGYSVTCKFCERYVYQSTSYVEKSDENTHQAAQENR